MAIAKRVFLFLAVNLAMMVTINLVLGLLGVGRYLTPYGLDYSSLAAFCLVWGMAGSLFSLLTSRFMAKMFMGVQLVEENAGGEAGQLLATVYKLARAANLPRMPEVGIYDSPEVNAFATGPSKGHALVAVSSGLLRTMDRDEVEGVLAHEISHVANGDMVTLTLIQGIVNAFVMFFARIAAFALASAMQKGDDRDRPVIPSYFVTMLFEIVLGLFGMMIVAAFSRWREYRADAGGASLAGRDRMRRALQRLRSYHDAVDTSRPAFQAMKINGAGAFLHLFATHPPLDERIRRLEPGYVE